MPSIPHTPPEHELRVRLSEDRMIADLLIPAGFPPQLMTRGVCAAAFAEKGVIVRDPQLDAIERQLAVARRRADRESTIRIEGMPARDGLDGYIQFERRFVRPAHVAHAGDERVDYYAQSRFVNVHRGDIVARLHPPTLGEDGVDVTGRIRHARAGHPAPVRIDPTLSVDGQGRCMAEVHGVLLDDRGSLRVCEVLQIAGDVDFSTGNIAVEAGVEVLGSVKDRFAITTPRSVKAHKLVEGATIRAGGDFIALGGMAGKLKGRLDIAGDLVARYLDNVVGWIGGKVSVEREIVNSSLDVDGEVRLDLGAMVGSTVYARGPVTVNDLGSDGGELTVIGVGEFPDGEAADDDRRAMLSVNRRLHAGVFVVIGELAYRFDHAIRGPLWLRRDAAGRVVICNARSGTCTRLCRVASAQKPPDRGGPSGAETHPEPAA